MSLLRHAAKQKSSQGWTPLICPSFLAKEEGPAISPAGPFAWLGAWSEGHLDASPTQRRLTQFETAPRPLGGAEDDIEAEPG